MFQVGDIIISKFRHPKLNFKVIEIKDESTIRIKSPRMEGGLYMLVNVNHWKLDVNYYRKLKLLKLKEKING
jgi:hypothetical protein